MRTDAQRGEKIEKQKQQQDGRGAGAVSGSESCAGSRQNSRERVRERVRENLREREMAMELEMELEGGGGGCGGVGGGVASRAAQVGQARGVGRGTAHHSTREGDDYMTTGDAAYPRGERGGGDVVMGEDGAIERAQEKKGYNLRSKARPEPAGQPPSSMSASNAGGAAAAAAGGRSSKVGGGGERGERGGLIVQGGGAASKAVEVGRGGGGKIEAKSSGKRETSPVTDSDSAGDAQARSPHSERIKVWCQQPSNTPPEALNFNSHSFESGFRNQNQSCVRMRLLSPGS